MTVVPVCCDARGVEAQPLILPQVPTAKGVRDVMVLPSMSDAVRGVDAHTGEDIWDVKRWAGRSMGAQVSTRIRSTNIGDAWPPESSTRTQHETIKCVGSLPMAPGNRIPGATSCLF